MLQPALLELLLARISSESNRDRLSMNQVVPVCLYGTSCQGTEVTYLQHTCLLSPCPLQHHAAQALLSLYVNMRAEV